MEKFFGLNIRMIYVCIPSWINFLDCTHFYQVSVDLGNKNSSTNKEINVKRKYTRKKNFFSPPFDERGGRVWSGTNETYNKNGYITHIQFLSPTTVSIIRIFQKKKKKLCMNSVRLCVELLFTAHIETCLWSGRIHQIIRQHQLYTAGAIAQFYFFSLPSLFLYIRIYTRV